MNYSDNKPLEYYITKYNCPESSRDVMERILHHWNDRYENENPFLLERIMQRAYIGSRGLWNPISDESFGKGNPYGLMIKKSGQPYSHPLKLYYPRGLWPLTWYEDYEAASRYTRYHLLESPELMMNAEIAVEVLVDGYFYELKNELITNNLNLS
jgi:hypothetical protein